MLGDFLHSLLFLACWWGYQLRVLELSISSVQFSCSVMSDSLRPHESQHVRPPCPSPTPRVYSNSYPLSWWCHPAISSSVVPFSSCPRSLPASGSFSNESTLCMRWPKYWSFSFSISHSNEHPGLISFRIDWLDLLAAQGTLKSLFQLSISISKLVPCLNPSSLAIPWVVKSQALGQKFPAKNAFSMSGKIWNQMKSFLMV